MATHGETIDVTLPTVVVSWAGSSKGASGSFTITGTDPDYGFDVNDPDPNDEYGVSTSLSRIDWNRTVKRNAPIATTYGAVTVTITPASNTEVHYSIGIKNPTYKAQTLTALTQEYKSNVGYIYAAPIVFDPPKCASPVSGHFGGKGNGTTFLRIRAYSVVGGKLSPNDKSKLLLVKFLQQT